MGRGKEKDMKKQLNLKEALDIKNGNAVTTVNNWLQLLGSPLRIVLIVTIVLAWLSLKKAIKSIEDLPETTAQVGRNTEAINDLEDKADENHEEIIYIKAKLLD